MKASEKDWDTPANNEDKVPRLEAETGRISNDHIDFSFGDGSDGDVVLNGSTDYASFSSRSGSIYTLTRDCYFDNLTINGGVTLRPAGWRIFVRNKIDGSGKLEWNGNNGSNGANGRLSESYNGGGSGGSAVSGYFINNAGTKGGDTAGQRPGQSGVTPSTLRSCLGNAGGRGGSGGTHSGDTGGVGTVSGGGGGNLPTITTPAQKFGIIKAFVLMGLDVDFTNTEQFETGTTGPVTTTGDTDFAAHNHTYTVPVSLRKITSSGGGTGGGGGGGSNAINNDQSGGAGGGGGASGGIIFVVARIWAGTFEIEAHGGNGGTGGNGSTSANDSAGGGGGGGGAGGVSIFIYQHKTWTGEYDLAGGLGGDGGAEGGQGAATQAGFDGDDGNEGVSYEFHVGDLI